MIKDRIPETDQGIQDQFEVNAYDVMQRHFRDKGIIETDDIIKKGITYGIILEIGPGPGYLGLEWLKKTENTFLRGIDISAAMIAVAQRNAEEYGLSGRTHYIEGQGDNIPFDSNFFDAVISTSSLHEWANPVDTFNEIYRVLKPSGKYFIGDLKRDINIFIKLLMKSMVKPKEMKAGFETSLRAAYISKEIKELLQKTKLSDSFVSVNPFGLIIHGTKNK